jgi:membrane protein
VAFFALLAVFPGIAAIVSLYGLFADATTIGKHLSVLSGFLPGGVLQLIAEQITVISRQGSGTLGTSFLVGLLIGVRDTPGCIHDRAGTPSGARRKGA